MGGLARLMAGEPAGSAMRRALLALAIAALLAWAPVAQAAPSDKHIEIEADDGEGCVQEAKNDCFRVVNGTSLDGIEQGMLVHVVVENVGDAAHNLYVTEEANADENNLDTASDDAINGSDTIDPGETTDLLFAVPADGEGLYFWCDVGPHEAMGMWLETDVAEAQNTTDDGGGSEDEGGNETTDEGADGTEGGDDPGRFLPAPGPIAALVAALGAALLVRRRR